MENEEELSKFGEELSRNADELSENVRKAPKERKRYESRLKELKGKHDPSIIEIAEACKDEISGKTVQNVPS